MKKAALFAGIFFTILSVASAQDTTSINKPATPSSPALSNSTVDSIAAKYKLQPMPEAMTPEQIFPVLGEYQPSATPSTEPTEAAPATEAAPSVSNVKVMLDEQNKGIVWIEGLPQGKVKAFLRKSPSTYKIPVQKTEDGKDVKEGTMIFDKDTKTLNIVIGKKFNDADPAAAFAPATEEPVAVAPVKKGKKAVKPVKVEKPWVFTGTKIENTTASAN